ncbi:hypothetical protein DITRI_Ditri11bG0149900 [Diplodiscus trichospermus]
MAGRHIVHVQKVYCQPQNGSLSLLLFSSRNEAAGSFGAIYGSNGTEKSDAFRISKALQSCQAVGWLDEQKPNSVVFVGFGSEGKLSRDQTYEIAYGIELSEIPFLWALRKPTWANDDIDSLPPGFAQRTQGRGVVKIGWAPQMEILGHSSIGRSLFHCGRSFAVETLQFGDALVALPFVFDQPLNARLLVEKGLAVEIDRGEDGSYDKNDIAKSLRLAMVSPEGSSKGSCQDYW